jgi:hypothetical protein
MLQSEILFSESKPLLVGFSNDIISFSFPAALDEPKMLVNLSHVFIQLSRSLVRRVGMSKRISMVLALIALTGFFFGFTAEQKPQKELITDAESYNAHFPNMDKNTDRKVNWEEFKAYFPQATPQVFEAIDLNKDKSLDHDEWHKFKAAYGLKHKD